MVFAMISIPITTASVVFCGRFITAAIKYFIISFESRVLKHDKITKCQRKIMCIELLLNLTVTLLLSLLDNKTSMQNYSFFDSFYFIFITISTIGFGDITNNIEYYSSKGWLNVVVGTGHTFLFLINYSLTASFVRNFVSLKTECPSKRK